MTGEYFPSGGPDFDSSLFCGTRLTRLCKGGGAPKPNKKLEEMQLRLMKAQLAAAEEKIEMPEVAVPPPQPPDPPPPGQTASDVTDAERAARQLAQRRRGILSTLLAGQGQNPAGRQLGGSAKLGGGAA